MKINDIEINDDSPFDNDCLDRKEEIINLSDLLLGIETPLVISLDAPWGAGKTTFVKLWRSYLKKKFNIKSIYYNAWETDYSDDPLIPLISEIDKYISENHSEDIISWNKTKKILPKVAKTSAILAAKVATFGGLDLGKEYEKIISDTVGNLAGDLVESFNNKKKSIDEFKHLLEETIPEISSETENIVIFIDELDRCRPDFTIALLERIKHLFDIKNVIFILSTDIEQLSQSIKVIYGEGFDSSKYLKRFINIEYALKEADIEKYVNIIVQSDHFYRYFSTRDYDYTQRFRNTFILLSKRFKMKLRDINQVSSRIFLILKSISANHFMDIELITTLVILREVDRELYKRYIDKPVIAPEVIEYIKLGLKDNDKYSHECSQISGLLLCVNKPDVYDKEKKYESLIAPYIKLSENADTPFEIKEWAKKVVMFSQDAGGHRFKIDLHTIHSKIELFDKVQINDL